jgi:hypothetical protein
MVMAGSPGRCILLEKTHFQLRGCNHRAGFCRRFAVSAFSSAASNKITSSDGETRIIGVGEQHQQKPP